MVQGPKTIHVEPGSELDRILEAAGEAPVELETRGVRYRVVKLEVMTSGHQIQLADTHDLWKGYDPEKVRANMRAGAGSWHDLDTETLKADLSRAREEGSRPLRRP